MFGILVGSELLLEISVRLALMGASVETPEPGNAGLLENFLIRL